MDKTAPAQYVIDTFAELAQSAVGNLSAWMWTTMLICFCWKVICSIYDTTIESGDLFDPKILGRLLGTFIFSSVVIAYYPTVGWEFAEGMRSLGYMATGLENDVPMGEMARRADVVTEAVDRAIDALMSWSSPLQSIKNIPTVLKLRAMEGLIYLIYMFLALITTWVFVDFCVGYILGASVIGTISWERTREMGMKGIMYLVGSGLSLMTLSIIQGFAEQVLAGAVLQDGSIATVEALSGAIWSLGVMLLLAVSAIGVTRGFMSAYAGASGVPTPNIAQRSGQAGAAIGSTMSSMSRQISNMNSRVSSMLSSRSGGGSSGRGNALPSGMSINSGAWSGSGGGGAQTAGAPASQSSISASQQAIGYIRGSKP